MYISDMLLIKTEEAISLPCIVSRVIYRLTSMFAASDHYHLSHHFAKYDLLSLGGSFIQYGLSKTTSSILVAMETLKEYRDAILIGAKLYVRNSARGTMISSNEPSTLTEADIPGASLGNREPEKFKIAELRSLSAMSRCARILEVEDEGRLRSTVSHVYIYHCLHLYLHLYLYLFIFIYLYYIQSMTLVVSAI